MPDRGDHADRHADQRNPDHRYAGKQDTRLRAVANDVQNRGVKENRSAKIAACDIRQPLKILNDDRLVETEFSPKGIDLVGRRYVAEQDIKRIAGNEMNEEKDYYRGPGKRRYGSDGPMHCVGVHS